MNLESPETEDGMLLCALCEDEIEQDRGYTCQKCGQVLCQCCATDDNDMDTRCPGCGGDVEQS